jgi:hypothetical protein
MNKTGKISRKQLLSWLIILAIISISLSSCAGQSAENSAEQKIVSNTISALGQVSTYKLDMDLTLTTMAESQNFSSKWQWLSQRQFDLTKNEMQITMNSRDLFHNEVTPNIWDTYIVDGWEYTKTCSPIIHGSDGIVLWSKIKLPENNILFSNEPQITPLVKLLKTASKVSLVGLENLYGADCYILHVEPSRESMGDWVISQQQPTGVSLWGRGEDSVLAKKNYIKDYQESWITIWIEKDSYLVKKAEINALFSWDSAGIRNFQGQMNFSDYNSPISITLPLEALSATGN